MKKILYLLVVSMSITISLDALPSVAICGFDASGANSGAGDEFSFVLLRDFTAGEVIYFTEDEYSIAISAFFSEEGHLEYTIPAGGLLNNDVVRIRETGVDVFAVQCATGTATIVGGSGAWSYSGSDELYAYSASSATTPWSTVTEIHCFYYGSVIVPPVDQDPTPDWPNTIKLAVNLGASGSMNADFMDAFRVNTTPADLKLSSNWLKSTSDITLSCTDFTNNMLPIELVSFNARLKGSEVLLEWVTESEVNNDRFEIEHSQDSKTFTAIGTVSGRGTSTEKNFYKMTHHTPNYGINYYRLKQIDYDGKFDYSEIEYVRVQVDSDISVYPNPAKEHIIIRSNNTLTEGHQFLVYDAMGRQINISSSIESEYAVRLNISSLESGIYFIKLSSGNMRKVIKL